MAPGRPNRPPQYVDVRDLARRLLSGLANGLTGPVDVISRSGHATTEQLEHQLLSRQPMGQWDDRLVQQRAVGRFCQS